MPETIALKVSNLKSKRVLDVDVFSTENIKGVLIEPIESKNERLDLDSILSTLKSGTFKVLITQGDGKHSLKQFSQHLIYSYKDKGETYGQPLMMQRDPFAKSAVALSNESLDFSKEEAKLIIRKIFNNTSLVLHFYYCA